MRAAEQRSRERLAAIAAERASLQKTFAAEFPDYAALSNPLPLKAKEIQSLLSATKRWCCSRSPTRRATSFAMTRDGFDWKRIPLGADALSQKVAAFRRGLDVSQASDASGKSGLFDLALANELYAALLGPVEALVKDKRSLLVAPSGALTALPFHLLVTEKPAAAISGNIRRLSRRGVAVEAAGGVGAAVGCEPESVARSLRAGIKAIKPMTGFGDPLFNPSPDGAGRRATATGKTVGVAAWRPSAYTDFWQGAGVDRDRLAGSACRSCPTPPTN